MEGLHYEKKASSENKKVVVYLRSVEVVRICPEKKGKKAYRGGL